MAADDRSELRVLSALEEARLDASVRSTAEPLEEDVLVPNTAAVVWTS